MADSQVVVVEGVILENLPNTMFRVKLTDETETIGYLSGKMRRNYIRLLPGDRVRLEVAEFDKTKGRIVFRLK